MLQDATYYRKKTMDLVEQANRCELESIENAINAAVELKEYHIVLDGISSENKRLLNKKNFTVEQLDGSDVGRIRIWWA